MENENENDVTTIHIYFELEVPQDLNLTYGVAMNSKEYWNMPSTTKKHIMEHLPYLFLYFVASLIFYLLDPEDLRWPIVVSALGLWWFLRVVNASRNMTTRPFCTITNDSIILDYDRTLIPWSIVVHVAVNIEKKRVRMWQSTAKNPVFQESSKNYARIDGRWVQYWDSFIKDLEAECNRRSIGYTVEEDKES